MFKTLPRTKYLERVLLEKSEPLEESVVNSTLEIIDYHIKRIYGLDSGLKEILKIIFYTTIEHMFIQGPLVELAINNNTELLNRLNNKASFALFKSNKSGYLRQFEHDCLTSIVANKDEERFIPGSTYSHYPPNSKIVKLFRSTTHVSFWPHILVKDGAEFYLVKNYAFDSLLNTIQSKSFTDGMGSNIHPLLFSFLFNKKVNPHLTRTIEDALNQLSGTINKINKAYGQEEIDFTKFEVKLVEIGKGGRIYDGF